MKMPKKTKNRKESLSTESNCVSVVCQHAVDLWYRERRVVACLFANCNCPEVKTLKEHTTTISKIIMNEARCCHFLSVSAVFLLTQEMQTDFSVYSMRFSLSQSRLTMTLLPWESNAIKYCSRTVDVCRKQCVCVYDSVFLLSHYVRARPLNANFLFLSSLNCDKSSKLN